MGEAMIKEKDGELAKLESDFKAFVDGLQKQYTEASEKKEKDAEAIKNSGLGLLKAVHAHEKKRKEGRTLEFVLSRQDQRGKRGDGDRSSSSAAGAASLGSFV